MANLEQLFISAFQKNSTHIGDDCAFIDGFVYGADAFIENTHFLKHWLTPFEIGQKAMLVNISDIIAMNAKPTFALTTVGFPKTMSEKDINELAKGLKQTAKNFGCEIIGGDTVECELISISITCIGKTDNPLFRHNVKQGDYLAYTGVLGNSKKDLEKLFKNEKIAKNSKFIKPKLKADFMFKAASYLNAAIDVSDGLFNETAILSRQSKVGIKLLKDIKDEIGCSGEEYELIVSFSPEHLDKVLQIAKETKTKLTIYAKAEGKEIFKSRCKAHHFN